MNENGQEKLSLEEKAKVIQDAAEEMNKLMDEQYQKTRRYWIRDLLQLTQILR